MDAIYCAVSGEGLEQKLIACMLYFSCSKIGKALETRGALTNRLTKAITLALKNNATSREIVSEQDRRRSSETNCAITAEEENVFGHRSGMDVSSVPKSYIDMVRGGRFVFRSLGRS